MKTPRVLGMILAGGQGSRLYPLTRNQVKPAVHFGGKYRVIDFVLSNFLNSGYFSLYVLVQYRSHALIEHLRTAWVERGMIREHFLTVAPPEMANGVDRYRGTADALLQNMSLIRNYAPDVVAVFGADHVFQMNIAQVVEEHLRNRADVTITAMTVDCSEAAGRFGVLEADSQGRVVALDEKPRNPRPLPGSPDQAYVSMGNFLFHPPYLYDLLERHADTIAESSDFSAHLLPGEVGRARMFAYDFSGNRVTCGSDGGAPCYWRDIGAIGSFFQAHMDLLTDPPRLNLNNPFWPIRGSRRNVPPSRLQSVDCSNVLISEGCEVTRARLRNVVLGRDIRIAPGAHITDSIIMDSAVIGPGARLDRAIVGCHCEIEGGSVLAPERVVCEHEYHIDTSANVIVTPQPVDVRQRPMASMLSTEEYY